MKPYRLSLCAALAAAVCGATASALLGADGVLAPKGAQALRDPQATPEALVRQVVSGMLEAGHVTSQDRREVLTYAEERVLPHVDFAEAARLAAGKLWARASRSQQAQLVAAYRPIFIRSYFEALRAHGGQTLEVLPAQAASRGANDITVQSRLEGHGEAPLTVEYALRRTGGEWKIYDIRIDGESLVASCRLVFEQVARTEGIAGLIKRMKGNARSRPVVTA